MNVFAQSESKDLIAGNGTLLLNPDTMSCGVGGSCGVDLSEDLFEGLDTEIGHTSRKTSILGDTEPAQDWFDAALKIEPAIRPVRSSWGDDDEDTDEELPVEDGEEEEQDPFEDFDEDDFDDDFDDDFEEELDDEYEIEPADDGMATETEDGTVDPELADDEEVEPDLEEEVE